MKYCLFLILLYSLNSCTGSDTQHTTAERSKIYSIPGLQWRIKTNGVVLLQPYTKGNNIYLITANKALSAYPLGNKDLPSTDITCLDKLTGNAKWTFHSNSFLSKPLISDKEVLIGSVDNCLYALNIQDGRIIWKYKSLGPIWQPPFFLNNHIVIICEDSSIMGPRNMMSDSCYVCCLNRADRKVIWTKKVEHSINTAQVYQNKIYYSSLQVTYIIDSSGSIEAVPIPRELQGSLFIVPSSVFDNGILYTHYRGNELAAYNVMQRKIQWSSLLPDSYPTDIQVDGDLVLVLDGVHTALYDKKNGKQLWQYNATDSINAEFLYAPHFVYITSKRKLVVLNKATSQKATEFDLNADSHCEPVVDNGIIYIGTEDSSFYAITAPNP